MQFSTMLVSLACSQVFLTAIFFSLIWKNPGEAEDDQPEDEEEPRLEHDEELLHKQNQGDYSFSVLNNNVWLHDYHERLS